MDELEKQQDGMERIGLLAGSLYSGMVRESVPVEVAERMTTQIVCKLLEVSQKRAQESQPNTNTMNPVIDAYLRRLMGLDNG